MLIKYAKDKEGNIKTIEEAIKGKKYYCIVCGEALIVRQGEIRAKHYSHKPSAKCSNDFQIEYFKQLIANMKDFFGWEIESARIDFQLDGYKPTVILKLKNKRFICIEIGDRKFSSKIYRGSI